MRSKNVRAGSDREVLCRACELAPGVDNTAWVDEALCRGLIKRAHPSIGFDLTEQGKLVEMEITIELQDERNRSVSEALIDRFDPLANPDCQECGNDDAGCLACGADANWE